MPVSPTFTTFRINREEHHHATPTLNHPRFILHGEVEVHRTQRVCNEYGAFNLDTIFLEVYAQNQ